MVWGVVVVGFVGTHIDDDGLDSHTHTHMLASNAMWEFEMWKCRTCLEFIVEINQKVPEPNGYPPGDEERRDDPTERC